jgi:hypothetical protein
MAAPVSLGELVGLEPEMVRPGLDPPHEPDHPRAIADLEVLGGVESFHRCIEELTEDGGDEIVHCPQ